MSGLETVLPTDSAITKENLQTVLPNPNPFEETKPKDLGSPSQTEDNAEVIVSRSPDSPPPSNEPMQKALSPVKKDKEEGFDHRAEAAADEEIKEIVLAEKQETGAGNDGVVKEIDAGKEASEDPESENKVETAVDEEIDGKKAEVIGLEGVTEVENGDAEGEKEVQDMKVDELEGDRDTSSLDEADLVETPPHWLLKACVRLTVTGGSIAEEEVLSVLSSHGTVSSIAFENEKKDTVTVRFDCSLRDDMLVFKIQEKLHNTQLDGRTLHVEPFKVDSLLFVGNLTPNVDDSELKRMFEPHGRVERAFVLRNMVGRSKGYGFVEFSLKSQAIAAKKKMITVPMDGRLLRVEWSDCKNVRDLFSSVLFVDRIPKLMVEASLRTLFEQYGKVKDLCLANSANGVSRGFAFIDFFKSVDADRAQEALDGHDFGGHNLRVSFANPSKSAQSYKQRLASQAVPSVLGTTGRGSVSAMQMPLLRGNMYMPFGGNRLTGAGQLGFPGMRLEMQFNHGAPSDLRIRKQGVIGRGSDMFVSGAPRIDMMGHSPFLDNNIPHRQRVLVSGGYGPLRQSSSRGAQPINSGAMAPMAASHVKAYEDTDKIRVEAYYKQAPQHVNFGHSKETHLHYPHHQQYQLVQQSDQRQHQKTVQQQSHPPPQDMYQQPRQSSTPHSLYQQHSQYHAKASETYPKPHFEQPLQQFYTSNQQSLQQYNQSNVQTVASHYSQPSQMSFVSNTIQQCQQIPIQTQSEAPYIQSSYTDQYAQQQPQVQNFEGMSQTIPAAPVSNSVVPYPSSAQDTSHLQAPGSHYEQEQISQPATGGSQFMAPVPGNQSQGMDEQWAAYYANQSTYQQQTPSYTHAQQQQPLHTSLQNYPEQQSQYGSYGDYQQPSSYQSSMYQQAMPDYSQQPPASYQQTVVADGYYQQQQPPANQAPQVYDSNKRPRY